jgi:aldehyde:ferredoxin oxidoreductase
MRDYIEINLEARAAHRRTLSAEEAAIAGRYLIAKTLVEEGIAGVDPLGPENPLIFSAGPFAGTNFSNANRLSVGCKSPLTGGIKESNAGGTFSLALGHQQIAGFTLRGACSEWSVIHLRSDGEVRFEPADPYLGLGNNEAAQRLHERYGEKVSLALCGPVGEYLGLLAGIAVSDTDRRPSRIAARGGVGAVMGAKKVKAIVADLGKMPPLADRKKLMGTIREYGALLRESAHVQSFSSFGTAIVADFTNRAGALPVRNFSAGQLIDPNAGTLEIGGDHIHDRNDGRGGVVSHACMPGCQIKCSNIYAGPDGEEIVSPLEYETIGLLGSNCGLDDPDDIARLNALANDLGVDTIEIGATLALLMEAGEAPFGDVPFMERAFADLAAGNERGRLLAQGTARVGEAKGVARVPVIKRQAISAYDPRVIEVTGISMMLTAQGADHTTGNIPTYECEGKSIEELTAASYEIQVLCALADSLGLCVFGRSVTNTNFDMIADAINHALGTELDTAALEQMGRETLRLEDEFNRAAGFTPADDELPAFFRDEPLPPTDKTARLRAEEVHRCLDAARAQRIIP